MNPTQPHKQTVLLVEDELPFRQIYRDALQMDGFAIIEAETGEEAIAAVEKQIPDVILLDLILPKMSGYDVLTQIKGNPKFAHIPVIVYSVLSEREEIERAIKLGANGYTIKGMTPAVEVANKVKAFLSGTAPPTADKPIT